MKLRGEILFGALLVASGIKLIRSRRSHDDPGQNPVLRLARKYLRTTTEYDGHQWFRRIKGTLYATPLFLVLLVVELTDMVFAIDSVPAVLAISDESPTYRLLWRPIKRKIY